MLPVVTAAQMRALDAATIEGIGLPGVVLMENAGRAVARAIEQLVSGRRGIPGGGVAPRSLGGTQLPRRALPPGRLDGRLAAVVAVVCGAGNNGGDGYVIARCLREAGMDVTVYLAIRAEAVTGDARLHLAVYEKMGGAVEPIADDEALAAHRDAIAGADVVVDAVFGTGLARAVQGRYQDIIETINRCPGHRVAVDIPSGLSADTGQVLGVAVAATCTVTMAFHKIGLVTSPGFAHCGQVRVAEIGIPASLAETHGVRTYLLEAADMAPLLPAVPVLAHKNRRGHVLAVAGSPGKRGAGRLLTWAALRTGAGLATLASPWAGGEVHAPDPVMTAALDLDGPDRPDTAGEPVWIADQLRALAQGKQALAVGPGMPTTAGGRALVQAALAALDLPLVLDADALNHVGTELWRVAAARAPVVLTPHPGEAARLLGCSAADIQADRMAAARALAAGTGAVVVLKGARTLVAHRDVVTINPTGHAALATAGSGDVLTGIIAALLAQGMEAVDAARLGVYLHGITGELAAADLGPRSVTAADLADRMPAAMARLEAAGSC